MLRAVFLPLDKFLLPSWSGACSLAKTNCQLGKKVLICYWGRKVALIKQSWLPKASRGVTQKAGSLRSLLACAAIRLLIERTSFLRRFSYTDALCVSLNASLVKSSLQFWLCSRASAPASARTHQRPSRGGRYCNFGPSVGDARRDKKIKEHQRFTSVYRSSRSGSGSAPPHEYLTPAMWWTGGHRQRSDNCAGVILLLLFFSDVSPTTHADRLVLLLSFC